VRLNAVSVEKSTILVRNSRIGEALAGNDSGGMLLINPYQPLILH